MLERRQLLPHHLQPGACLKQVAVLLRRLGPHALADGLRVGGVFPVNATSIGGCGRRYRCSCPNFRDRYVRIDLT